MGIPAYFRNIIQDYPNIIIPVKDDIIDYLCFDLNCAIHPCCQGETDETIMMKKVVDKIKECISITGVRKGIYVAIDGPAPRTKMEQQRQRRLKSSQETKVWDTNSITPGTLFMDTLSIYLQKELQSVTIPVLLSDSNEPGEGEHKIMKYIDTLSEKETISVYGLDADLIMLSMIRNHNIYLLRERTEYNIEKVEDEYIYCNVSLLKKYVVESIKKPYFKQSDKGTLYDYLVLCFFIGNDFILSTPSINIRYNGIQKLLHAYTELQKDFNGTYFLLTDSKELHLQNFKYLLEKLSLSEEQDIQDILHIRDKQQSSCLRRYGKRYKEYKEENYDSESDEYNEMIQNLPILERGKEKEIFAENYTKKYYLYNLYKSLYLSPEYNEILMEDIKIISMDYIRSIYWTVQYYFNECISWRWYYKHSIPPLLSDVYKECLELTCCEGLFTEKTEPYTPSEQLSIVLPQKSHGLIRDKREIYKPYYYPEKTPLHMFMKRYLWECHPFLAHSI